MEVIRCELCGKISHNIDDSFCEECLAVVKILMFDESVVVNCRTEEKNNLFLELASSLGIDASGNFKKYGETICYRYNKERNSLIFCSENYYKKLNKTIIVF